MDAKIAQRNPNYLGPESAPVFVHEKNSLRHENKNEFFASS